MIEKSSQAIVWSQFSLWFLTEQVLRFVNYMNKRRKNIKFSFESENDNSFYFPDVKTYREKDKFIKCVLRKDTFSGVYTNFSSFVIWVSVHTFTLKF